MSRMRILSLEEFVECYTRCRLATGTAAQLHIKSVGESFYQSRYLKDFYVNPLVASWHFGIGDLLHIELDKAEKIKALQEALDL